MLEMEDSLFVDEKSLQTFEAVSLQLKGSSLRVAMDPDAIERFTAVLESARLQIMQAEDKGDSADPDNSGGDGKTAYQGGPGSLHEADDMAADQDEEQGLHAGRTAKLLLPSQAASAKEKAIAVKKSLSVCAAHHNPVDPTIACGPGLMHRLHKQFRAQVACATCVLIS